MAPDNGVQESANTQMSVARDVCDQYLNCQKSCSKSAGSFVLPVKCCILGALFVVLICRIEEVVSLYVSLRKCQSFYMFFHLRRWCLICIFEEMPFQRNAVPRKCRFKEMPFQGTAIVEEMPFRGNAVTPILLHSSIGINFRSPGFVKFLYINFLIAL